jgi:hypothetical protein
MKAGAVCAIGGSVLLFAGTYLHPMEAEPNDAVEAFTEYAADNLWIASHLMQLAGCALIIAALLLLSWRLETTNAAPWSRLAAGGAVASLAVATALQAVDGVALKVMVDNWVAAPATQKDAALYAAFAVRQVEIGLASTASLLFGLTVIMYGLALLRARIYPVWIAGSALLPGVGSAIAGVVTAYSGFSELAMAISMPAGSLLLLWMVGMGVLMWQCK